MAEPDRRDSLSAVSRIECDKDSGPVGPGQSRPKKQTNAPVDKYPRGSSVLAINQQRPLWGRLIPIRGLTWGALRHQLNFRFRRVFLGFPIGLDPLTPLDYGSVENIRQTADALSHVVADVRFNRCLDAASLNVWIDVCRLEYLDQEHTLRRQPVWMLYFRVDHCAARF
jgi:hypothetical protein